jgi:hypothetical protein
VLLKQVRSAALVAVLVSALTACGGGDKETSGAPSLSPSPTKVSAPSPETPIKTEPPASADEDTVNFVMPSFVGMILQDAQDKVQTYGIFFSRSHDLLGSRSQVIDSNWKVCTQTPAKGTRMRGKASDFEGKIDFGAVKLTESCP